LIREIDTIHMVFAVTDNSRNEKGLALAHSEHPSDVVGIRACRRFSDMLQFAVMKREERLWTRSQADPVVHFCFFAALPEISVRGFQDMIGQLVWRH